LQKTAKSFQLLITVVIIHDIVHTAKCICSTYFTVVFAICS